MKRKLLVVLSGLALSGASSLQALNFNNNVGLIGVGITPTYTVNFNSAPGLSQNSTVTNQFTFAGVTFSSPAFYDGNSAGAGCSFNDFSGDSVTNYTSTAGRGLTSVPTTPFSILFALPQTYAAFALVTDTNGSANTQIQIFNGNSPVEAASFTTGSGGAQGVTVPNYFGFYGTSGFDRITITTSGSNLVILDNVQLQNIPEPGTVAMVVLGLGAVITGVRRRRVV